eukprot:scaffold408544_cov37-Prasinocladus_malaysianus.AAC.1
MCPQAELNEFQRRNWKEMKAAAERNWRRLAGDDGEPGAAGDDAGGAGSEPARQEAERADRAAIDDNDVAEHAA